MPGGRPTKMIEKVIAKLEQAFLMGCTDEEACLFADISRATLGRYEEKYPEFRDRKATLKTNPVMKARQVILSALADNDVATAHKAIDRKEGSKFAITGRGGGPLEVTEVRRIIVDPAQASRGDKTLETVEDGKRTAHGTG